MKKSEFESVFPQIVDRCRAELIAEIKELSTPNSAEGLAAYTAQIIAASLKTSAQITFDTIVNLDLLEED